MTETGDDGRSAFGRGERDEEEPDPSGLFPLTGPVRGTGTARAFAPCSGVISSPPRIQWEAPEWDPLDPGRDCRRTPPSAHA